MSELVKRVLVALIGIPVAVAIIWIGDFVFFLFLLFISNFVLFEFYNLSNKKNIEPYFFFGILVSTLIQTFYYLLLNRLLYINTVYLYTLFAITIAFTPILLLFVQVWNRKTEFIINVSYTLLGIYWVSFTFITVLSIRFLPEFANLLSQLGEIEMPNLIFVFPYSIDNTWSAKFFLVVLGTIWLCDSFAYFIGLRFGKHKLAPKTSPKKTWEGAIGGYFGAIFVFFILDFSFSLNLPLGYKILFASIVGIVGQIGDLAESKIKREFNVKDSSNILPGHGGFLDRMDSIMFVYPAIFLVLFILMVF